MNALIDTHIFLWMVLEPGRLSEKLKRRLLDPGTTLFMSTAAAWEVAIKHAIGKIKLLNPPDVFVPAHMQMQNIELLPIELHHVLSTHRLPMHHRDPFDRIMIAQAQAEKLPMITTDPHFRRYDIELLA